MSKTIAAITDSSTFSVWKQQSNDLASHAAKAVTMTSTGTPGDNNEGNISLNGNLALEAGHTITVDTITGNSTAIELQKNLRIDGVGATSLTFSLSDTPKWILRTSADHGYFEVVRGNRYFRITSDGSSTGAITGSGVTLNKALLPASIDAATTGNAATATLATKVTVTNNTANTAFPVVFHNEESANSLLDDTGTFEYNPSTGTITTTKLTATGAVTAASVSTTGTITATGGFIGNINGDINGSISGNVSGNAGGLTSAALTEVLKAVYPIGSLYTTTTDTDPSTLRSASGSGLGFGTWERYAEGRTLVSKDEGLVVTNAAVVSGSKLITVATTPAKHDFSVGEKVSFFGMGGQDTLAGASSNLAYPSGGDLFSNNVSTIKSRTDFVFTVELTSTPSNGNYTLDADSKVVRSWCQQVNSTSASSQGGRANDMMSAADLPTHHHEYGADDQIDNTHGMHALPGTVAYDASSTSTSGGQYNLTERKSGTGRPYSDHDNGAQVGEQTALDNKMPYKTVSIWRRTA